MLLSTGTTDWLRSYLTVGFKRVPYCWPHEITTQLQELRNIGLSGLHIKANFCQINATITQLLRFTYNYVQLLKVFESWHQRIKLLSQSAFESQTKRSNKTSLDSTLRIIADTHFVKSFDESFIVLSASFNHAW